MTHLGHVLHCSLDDSLDIKRATLEICKKANIVLSTFSSCNPQVKTVLFASHCLSLYSGVLCDISCSQLTSLEEAFNNILRHILEASEELPHMNTVAHLDNIFNSLSDRFSRKICESKSSLLHDTFILFYNNAFTPIGHNRYSSHKHQQVYLRKILFVPT